MKKVLVVDDTKNIRMILTKCLELEGYEVLTASDGTQALELFMTHSFDLAFLDIKLPGVRGTEVLKRIREKGIKTPVIIITAYATVKNAVDCTNLGAVAYVQKPFSADKIRNVLMDFENSSLSSKNEENSDSFILRAKSYLDADEFEKSLDFAQKALAKDVENPELYLLISRAYRGMGNEKSAERFYQFYKTFISE
ncbi:response regulator receiver protein [Ruminiclostridium papyrosolvens DSM 2782]|uniref:Stage 0 sporulation protein A homolog n=1 Tax=Ruminiclostridium papyrosolvens DSM 2782 TaxID=588581 RepID=F1TB68_9FIRM|nr:response regulator [Ruminiclostridium papyrosolvens]EGD48272.1 response regulator receiver protein [Ruminiclostridium papyrosolvens DSM 2782]WES34221.1 response regulator [Ruminiclostridium papyrosolvens DSM 2782]